MNTQSQSKTDEGEALRREEWHYSIRLIGNLWAVYRITSDGYFLGDQEMGNRRFILFSDAEAFLRTLV